MKLLSCALLLLASVAFVLSGCSDSPGSLVTPSSQVDPASTPAAALSKKGPIVHRAEGAGNAFFDGINAVYAFTAHEYADGTVSGIYRNNAGNAFSDKTLNFSGDVLNLRVLDGNIALILGCEKTGAFVGSYDVFLVIDNGDPGSWPTPDQIGYYFKWFSESRKGDAEAYFNDHDSQFYLDDLQTMDIDKGNIRVY